MKSKRTVTISELKQSPAQVLDEAKASGGPVGIIRNNVLEGYLVPTEALELIEPELAEVQDALNTVFAEYGDALQWLANR